MGFLVAKVGCSIAVALLLKHSDQLKLNYLGVIRINYAAAAIVSFLLIVTQPGRQISNNTIWVGIIAGFSYVASLLLWARAIEESGIALTVGISRVAIIIPILSSIFIWKEIPRWYQGIGIVFGLVATGIISRQGAGDDQTPKMRHRRELLLIALFIASGIANLSAKLFIEMCPAEDNYHFQTLLFVVAFLVASIVYFIRKERVDLPTFQWGSLLGLVNLGSSIFIILALQTLSGTIAFPISAALEVAAIALLGRFVWKERLSRLSVVGLILTVVALVLVQLR